MSTNNGVNTKDFPAEQIRFFFSFQKQQAKLQVMRFLKTAHYES